MSLIFVPYILSLGQLNSIKESLDATETLTLSRLIGSYDKVTLGLEKLKDPSTVIRNDISNVIHNLNLFQIQLGIKSSYDIINGILQNKSTDYKI